MTSVTFASASLPGTSLRSAQNLRNSRRVVAKIEWHPGELFPRVGFVVTNMPMDPEWGKGPYNELFPQYAHGKKLYEENCIKCHGETGMGDVEKFYPRINGQHYKYMLRQFEWIRDGKRRNANPDMVKQIEEFSDADMQNVINYASWIEVPKAQQAPSKDWKNPDFD